jgi:ABC-type amino acid transport substrate-binding protein
MKTFILTILLTLLTFSPAFAGEKAKESTYDRVMRTGTIRCGYVVYPPNMIKDVNTGEISGIAPAIIEKIAAGLSLKVEWAEEVGTASMIEGLKTKRYDMVCNTTWASIARTREVAYSKPAYYIAVNAISRIDDKRFDNNLKNIDDAAVKIATIDGSVYTLIAQSQFPKATLVSYPDLTDPLSPMMDVMMKKADIAFTEDYTMKAFMDKNSGKLQKVASDKPVQLFHASFMAKGDEFRFIRMIDDSLSILLDNGDIDKILDQYEKYPNSYKRLAKPYRE